MPERATDRAVELARGCEVCRRSGVALTRHHPIPRMRHGARRTQRTYDKSEMRERVLWVCRACHDHIHAVLAEKDLAAGYTTREALLAHPGIARFVHWIRRNPPGLRPRSHAMKRRGGRRSTG